MSAAMSSPPSPASPSLPVNSPPAEEGGILALLATLMRRWRLLATIALSFGVVGFIVAKVNRRWSVEATMRPQSTNQMNSRLSGLAAQFGFALPGAPVGDPVRFYAELLQSREVLLQAVQTPFIVAKSAGSTDSLRGTFLDLYNIKGRDAADRARRGRERLKEDMAITSDREAGFVRLKLVTKWPDLSLKLGSLILELTNASSVAKQRRQAEAERTFVEGRMKESQRALEGAENDMERFLATNRSYESSPLLNMQYGRLQRRVDMRQQVYSGLAQAYEQARIDEVRDTPLLVVVDGIEGSLRTGRRAWRDAILWLLAGGVLGMLVVLGLDGVAAYRRRHASEVAEIAAELRSGWPLQRHG
jgi:uncharacterized protein involved in exopolysaccharide biosynthesis